MFNIGSQILDMILTRDHTKNVEVIYEVIYMKNCLFFYLGLSYVTIHCIILKLFYYP